MRKLNGSIQFNGPIAHTFWNHIHIALPFKYMRIGKMIVSLEHGLRPAARTGTVDSRAHDRALPGLHFVLFEKQIVCAVPFHQTRIRVAATLRCGNEVESLSVFPEFAWLFFTNRQEPTLSEGELASLNIQIAQEAVSMYGRFYVSNVL
jgi:hypothetical protein